MLIGVAFAGTCLLFFAYDIVKEICCQFQNKPHEWYTIKVLKAKREWWKWVLAIAAFAWGMYWFLPSAWVGKADFRASRQKPEYTAYYPCNFNIPHYKEGFGHIELIKEDNTYTISRLYTDDGFIVIDHVYDSYDALYDPVTIYFCDENSYISINDGPVSKDIACTGKTKEVFGYPDATKDYCLACRVCGAGYYARCLDSSEWMCPDCTENCSSNCSICFEPCPPWRRSNDEFVICEYCLHNSFKDEDLRYYFVTGE